MVAWITWFRRAHDPSQPEAPNPINAYGPNSKPLLVVGSTQVQLVVLQSNKQNMIQEQLNPQPKGCQEVETPQPNCFVTLS